MAEEGLKETELALLLRATSFAASKHKDQRRKDHTTPYINHPIAVAENLTAIGGITDINTIVAAILHDTIEDTETTGDELEEYFGPEIRKIVEEVTDDKKLPKEERKRMAIKHAANKSDAAKCLKLADKCANLADIISSPPTDWSHERKLKYVNWATEVAEGLRGVNPALEARFDALCEKARALEGG